MFINTYTLYTQSATYMWKKLQALRCKFHSGFQMRVLYQLLPNEEGKNDNVFLYYMYPCFAEKKEMITLYLKHVKV